MIVRITRNVSSPNNDDEQCIEIDDGSVFVTIDVAARLVKNLSARLRDGIVLELGRSNGPLGSYPSFLISDVDKAGNVLSRKFITKSSGEWLVEDC